MENFLKPTQLLRCIITGPRCCKKSLFVTNINLNNINEYEKIYTYSPSLHQDLYRKLIICFSNYIPIHIVTNILNEDDMNLVIEGVIINKEKTDTEIETYESREESKFSQDYEDKGFIILDDQIEREMNDPRVQAMFKRSRHNNLSIFIISQDY